MQDKGAKLIEAICNNIPSLNPISPSRQIGYLNKCVVELLKRRSKRFILIRITKNKILKKKNNQNIYNNNYRRILHMHFLRSETH